MYELCPNPFIGQTVWHQGRGEFGKVVAYTPDPDSVLLEIDGEWLEVSRHFLEKSVFREDNIRPEERKVT